MIADPPSEQTRERVAAALAPLARVVQPKLYGAERVPDNGALLVGNHTIYGLLDVPFTITELWKERQVFARGLGDHAHYAIPGWRNLLEQLGMVRGTRANVHALMDARETILVFPGGSREVNKRKGEKYRLIWKERLGFARLAIAHQYPVVPFAAVGAEEMLDVVIDDGNPLYGALSDLTERVAGVALPSIVRGVGATVLPRPQKLYFSFGEPIATKSFGARGEQGVRALRDQVRDGVQDGIAFLQRERDADPESGLVPRLRRLVPG